jgi:hypothetical protein
MNKQFNWLLALVLVFMFSCSDDAFDDKQKNNEMVDFTVTTSIPIGIKTYASDNGGATNVDEGLYDLRYILEAWTKDGRLAYRGYKIVEDNFAVTSVNFTARLLAMEYDFVFWADFVNNGTEKSEASDADLYYTTNEGEDESDIKDNPQGYAGLTAIKIKTDINPYHISNDARDAYYAKVSVDLSTTGQIDNVTLKRPFGKYRIIATDTPPDGFLVMNPNKAIIKYTEVVNSAPGTITLPGGFNALTGGVTDRFSVKDISYEVLC